MALFYQEKSPFTPVVRDRNLEGISDCSDGSSSENFLGGSSSAENSSIHWVSNFYIIFLPFQVSDITAAFSHEWLWRNHISPAPSLSIFYKGIRPSHMFSILSHWSSFGCNEDFFPPFTIYARVPRLKWLQNGKGFLSCVLVLKSWHTDELWG